MLQAMTGGVKQVELEAENVRQVVDGLDQLFPGMRDRLVMEGRIRPNLAIAIDGEVARMGLLEQVGDLSEVHFVPAIGGGAQVRSGRHVPVVGLPPCFGNQSPR
jgi:molybdopterin synthase sulfur carrier subunit